MSLTPGTRLGAYEVTAKIGEGGMGEVYRATDTNLKRQVAIKVLPASVAADVERLARFQREAEVLAALNHPNIAGIYGLEKTPEFTALVMELVEGEDLSQRIARGAIPVDEALPIAKQIAEALEAAHEQGIIHRDLKPANIKVRPDGTVKVLDFGLAKALEPAGAAAPGGSNSMSPTITTPAMTQAGMILGTAAYMAPEQARGRPVDKRADIWAFGAVLYEMLTGRRAFPGEDLTDTLAAVVRAEPDWALLPAGLSSALVVFLKRCLQKDPKQRIPDIAAMRLALDGAFETAAPQPPAPVAVRKSRRALGWLVAAAIGAAAASALWLALRPTTPVASSVVRRFALDLPPTPAASGNPFAGVSGRRTIAISPTGDHVAIVAYRRLWLRPIDQLDAVLVRDTDGSDFAREPFFSPDGRWLAYWQAGQLRKVSVTGGAPVTLCDLGESWGATWGDDDTIVFGWGAKGVWRVSAQGGVPEQVVALDASRNEAARQPQMLPGGKAVLFTVTSSDRWQDATVVARRLDSQETVTLAEDATDGRYLPSGHVVFVQRGVLQAVPFDPRTLRVTGGPVAVADALRFDAGLAGAADYQVSDTGTLVYVPASVAAASPRALVSVDRAGRETAFGLDARPWEAPRLSPDSSRVALQDGNGGDADIVVADLRRNTTLRLTFDQGPDSRPLWSPDGRWVYYRSDVNGPGIYRKPSDGSGAVEKMTEVEGDGAPNAITPDGQWLLFSKVNGTTGRDIWTLDIPTKSASPLLAGPGNEGNPSISPNGRWVAYQHETEGQILVRPFPNAADGQWQVARGAKWALWSKDGRELFYQADQAMFAVPVDTAGAAFQFGSGRKLWEHPYFNFGGFGGPRGYDLSADGTQFLVLKNLVAPAAVDQRIMVVENWFEELKRRVPAK